MHYHYKQKHIKYHNVSNLLKRVLLRDTHYNKTEFGTEREYSIFHLPKGKPS